ncbi:MAG TPA: C25 family cysteine peptidase, partial [bacterium]
MRKIALIFLMFAAAANAEWRPLHPAGESQRPEFIMLDHSASGDLFEMILPGIEMTTATLDAKSWDRVEIYGGGFDQEIGKPEVPQVTRLVAIPRTAGVRAEVTILEEQLLAGIDLMPAQGIAPDEGPEAGRLRHFRPETYAEDRYYPEKPVVLGEPAIMRGLRVIPVQINPLRYNPVTRELRVATRMQITMTYEGQDLRNASIHAPRRFSASWANLARSSIVNFDEVSELDETLTGSYLVICENDNALVNAINNQFVDWKRRKGHTVVLQTFTAGASNTTIKNMIQSAYNTWDPAPEFILLVGDSDGDYALPGWDSYVGDHPYSQLDGSDLLADVAVGRMPAGNMTEAATLLNKVIWYEKQPYTFHDDWFHQGVLIASEGTSGISTIQTKRWIKTRMIQHGFTRIDTLWYTMGGSVVTVVSNAINGGVGYFNYRGYLGMSGWQNYNTYALNNGFMLPFVTIPTCGTGGFSGESRAEAFAIAGTPTTGQGAVASYGTATSGTNTRCNNVVDVGTYYGIFDEDINEAGNALNRGKLELFNAYITINSGFVSSYSFWNNLAGDPGLELWTGPIAIIAAQIPDQLNFGENQLTVTVLDTLNQPVEGALVCAYKANEMQITALTQIDGSAHLLLDPVTAGNVKVTITKENCRPVLDSLNLVLQAAQVGFYSSAVDDDPLGESRGDDDGLINPGETVEIPIMLKNFGSSTTVSDVRLVAATTDSLVRPGDMVESYGNIAPGATSLSLDDIDFRVNLNAPEGHLIHFDLTITSVQGSWTSGMELAVSAPILEASGAIAVGGDGVLSPGETAEMIITTRNLGSDAATGVTAKLRSLDAWITLTDSLATYGTIAAGASVNNTTDHFTLIASASAPAGWEAPM